ncbi:MAG: hypothetical protein AB8B96_12400 [Lysobacterales bacterium]
MILTGYALYYIGNDAVRYWLSLLHWVAGGPALAVFFLHIRRAQMGMKSANQRENA